MFLNIMGEMIKMRKNIKIFLKKVTPNFVIQKMPGKFINYFRNKLIDQHDHTIPQKRLQFEVHLTEHCNLNCKGCDNFSSIAAEEYTNPKVYSRDCARLSELFQQDAERILLLGGEPLLHPQIISFLEITRANFPHSPIHVVTNGILLLKMQSSFWEACKKNNIVISITKYPIKIDFKKILETAKIYDVIVQYFGSSDETEKSLWKIPLDLGGSQDAESNFVLCHRANNCIFLRDGRLFTCSFASNLRHFNQYFEKNIPITPENSIDIFTDVNACKILEFLSKPIPLCKYCKLKKMEYGIKWGVSKKKIEEWV